MGKKQKKSAIGKNNIEECFSTPTNNFDFDTETGVMSKLNGDIKPRKRNNKLGTWNYEGIMNTEDSIRKIKSNQKKGEMEVVDDIKDKTQMIIDNEEDTNVNLEKFENDVYAKDCAFTDFNLSKLIIKSLSALEYFTPTKVQE